MQKLSGLSLLCAALVAGCSSRYQAPIDQAGDPLYFNSGRQHLVNEGETLYVVAWLYDLDPNQLARANNLDVSAPITPGQKLLVDLRNFKGSVATLPAAVATAKTVEPENTGVAVVRPAQGLGGLSRATLPSSGTESGAGLTRTPLPSTEPAPAPIAPKTPASSTAATTAPAASEAAKAVTTTAKAVSTAPAGASVASTATTTAATAGAATKAAPSAFSGTGDVSWAWPYRGNIVGKFSEAGTEAKGIDLAGKEGDPILAAADGEVVYAGGGLLRYGNLLIIKHNDKYLSAYAHNKALLVGEKAKVTKGQKIAELGSSGIDKPQLHFEIRVDGKPVDPLALLPAVR